MTAADLDGDGKIDLASASPIDGAIAWHCNINGDDAHWEATVIVSVSVDGVYSIVSGDIDSDGRLDIAAASATAFELD